MNGILELLAAEWRNLAWSTAAHLDLTLEAILIAAAIGVPLGILASRSRRVETLALGAANVLQTVPSLALLGLLLILFRGQIGKTPALAALIVYAILPILKNTILGLRSIDRGVEESAIGMGMTAWQRLRIVQLPLASPIILGGIRVATVASIGMATIAAAIGAKGLGSYIYRGISLADPRLIALGSVPAALLALLCDGSLGALERRWQPGPSRQRGRLAYLAVGVIAVVAGLGFWQERGGLRGGAATIVIASKDSAEPILLGHMLADLVEAETSLKVDRRLNLAGTLICYNSLRDGGIDAYVEYTGTTLAAILKRPPLNDPRKVYEVVKSQLAAQGVTVLDPIGFENTFAILMRRSQAERLGLKRISDLTRHQETLRSGFGPEFMNRQDGYPGLVAAYGLRFANAPREMDRNLLYEAVARDTLDVAAGDSTDGRVSALELVQLADDRHYFPPYEAVPLVRAETLRKHPELVGPLNRLAGAIDASTMQKLNHEVDGLKKDPAAVAKAFLRERRLIP